MQQMKSINFLLTLNVGKENNMSYTFPFTLFNYFKYYFTASNGKGHGVHSPFVYSFIRYVLNDKGLRQEANYSNKYRALLIRMVAYYMPANVMELEASPLSKVKDLEEIEIADSIGLLYVRKIKNAEDLILYFNATLKKLNTQSILIFDGIHDSKEMESSWKKIKMHCEVKLTIDLYKLGIAFFRQEQLEKENFTIRF
jgi:hypothetical protein